MRMRPIPSTGGRYWAGDDGRIYPRKRIGPLRTYDEGGYPVVRLWGGSGKVTRRVCRLVAEAWLDGFNSATEVHHINRDPCDNRPCNLAPLSKAAHLRIHGRHVDDVDFADCEAEARNAPPPRPLFDDACRIEELMGEASMIRERLERKGVRM